LESVTSFSAFIAGVLSFISPGVLPLIPGYLSFISGVSLEEMRGPTPAAGAKRQVIITSLLFILSFSLVFVVLGASATVAGQFMLQQSTLLRTIAGVLLIIFGLHTIGILKIPFLLKDARVQAVVAGISFAFGWTPYIGPILAAILAVASQPASVSQGIGLLSTYSGGLAIPFLFTALAINQFIAFSKTRPHYHTIEIVSGALIITTGVLIFTNRFTIIAQWLTPYLPTF
jgi:cytochrome c-type biogenesis protein